MPRNLHIGGQTASPGWEVLNVNPASYVDNVGNESDLPRFADNTFNKVYSSHVLEHLDYSGELISTLVEWQRVLEPGGKLHIIVPDLDILASLFVEKGEHSLEERFMIMRMIFGGYIDQHDYHLTGLCWCAPV